jgi:hypothetical protein
MTDKAARCHYCKMGSNIKTINEIAARSELPHYPLIRRTRHALMP